MKRIVQFDMDGVLADFGSGYRRLHEQLTGERIPFPAPWDALSHAGTWATIKDSASFWYSLPQLVSDETLRRIQLLQARGSEVYFVTHRMGAYVKAQTEDWLRRRGIFPPTVIVSKHKAEFAKAVGATHAIDDKFGNAYFISCYSRDTASYLLDAPWNQVDHDVVGGTVFRIKTVEDFLDIVEAD